MWLDNLKEIKQEKKMSVKQIAELANLPEKTVNRVLSGKTANPYIDTLDRIANALDCSIGDILADTKAVVGDATLSTLQENIDFVVSEKETVEAQRDLLLAENSTLKAENSNLNDQIKTLNAKIEILEMKLALKEELLAVHNLYNKLLKG